MTGLFTAPTDTAAVTKALSASINDLSAAVEVMDGKLPTEAQIKRGTINFGTDTGTANTHLVALPYTPSGYVDGLEVEFLPLATNTGATTINVNSLGVKSLKRADGSALSAGDITVGIPISAKYSTVTGYMHMSGSSSVDAAAAAASASAASSSASAASASASAAATSETNAAASATTASAATTFLQAGSGAVTRTNQNKMRDIISVFDFMTTTEIADVRSGAASVNVTTAVQAAVTAIAGNYGALYIPQGTYLITTAIAAATSRIYIFGDGPNASIFTTTSPTINIFNFGDGVTMYTDVFMEGIGFAAAGAGLPRTAGSFVKFNKITKGGVNNFTANVGYQAIYFLDCVLTRATNGYITNPTVTTGVGIRIRGGNDHNIANVLVAGDASNECLAGVLIESTGATWLDNVGGLNSGIGLLLQPSTGGDVVEHVFSSRCAWDNCSSHGMLFDAAVGTTIRRCKFVQDWSSTNGGDGISIAGAGTIQDLEFVGHRSYNNVQRGFSASAGTQIRIIGGTFAGNSSSSSGTHAGILFDNMSHFSVIGAISGGVGGFSNTQSYGVLVNNAASDNYVISECNLSTNVTGAYTGPTITATKVVRNNIGYLDCKDGVASGTTDGSGDITVTHGLPATPTVVNVSPTVNAVNIVGVHTIGATTFKVRYWNGAAAGAALTSFSTGNLYWSAKIR